MDPMLATSRVLQLLPLKDSSGRRLTAAEVLARDREARINACHVVQPRLNHGVVYRRKSDQREPGRISIFGPKTHDGVFFTKMTASVICNNPKHPGCRWMISTYSTAGTPMEADAIYWLLQQHCVAPRPDRTCTEAHKDLAPGRFRPKPRR